MLKLCLLMVAIMDGGLGHWLAEILKIFLSETTKPIEL
jgi:hypothetical protein